MLKTLLPLIALAAAGTAQAGVVTLFEDDFDSYAPQLGITTSLGTKWTVTGNVDLVTTPNGFGITCSGGCVDLDGTTGPGRITSTSIAYRGGAPVTVRFDLSGSQRSAARDQFQFLLDFGAVTDIGGVTYDLPTIGVGSAPGVSTSGLILTTQIPGTNPWASYFVTFNPVVAGDFNIAFATSSSDNIGPLLDNVLVTQPAVPEPATWAMLIAGFGLVGFAARRRRATVAA